MTDLNGKRIIVTGASKGIGAATAQAMLARGGDRDRPLWRRPCRGTGGGVVRP